MGKEARIKAQRKAAGIYVRQYRNYRDVVIDIPRSDVESADIEYALSILNNLSKTQDSTIGFRNKLFIAFAGYDNDLREIWEIDHVRTYFAKLTEAWPYILWFINQDVGEEVIMLCMLVADVVKKCSLDSQKNLFEIKDMEMVRIFFEAQRRGIMQLLLDHGISLDDGSMFPLRRALSIITASMYSPAKYCTGLT
jgi:hypothetical protein